MPDLKPIRLGVIGLGVGEQHLKGYSALENVTVTAVSDLRIAHARRVVASYQLENVFITDKAEQLLDSGLVDAVSICSYDDFHATQAMHAFGNRLHVMLEKPAVLQRQELYALTKAWQDSGCRLSSNLILRASPRFQELRAMLAKNELGDVFYLEGDYLHQILWKLREGWRGKMPFYSVMFGGGVHLIDLMRFLLGKEALEVCTMGTSKMSQGSPYKFEDTAVSLLQFEDDILAKCCASFATHRPQLHALSVFGSKGSWHNDHPHGKLFLHDHLEKPPIKIDSPYPGIQKYALLGSFVASIRDKTSSVLVGGEDVVRTMDVCLTAVDAMKEKKTLPISYTI